MDDRELIQKAKEARQRANLLIQSSNEAIATARDHKRELTEANDRIKETIATYKARRQTYGARKF